VQHKAVKPVSDHTSEEKECNLHRVSEFPEIYPVSMHADIVKLRFTKKCDACQENIKLQIKMPSTSGLQPLSQTWAGLSYFL